MSGCNEMIHIETNKCSSENRLRCFVTDNPTVGSQDEDEMASIVAHHAFRIVYHAVLVREHC